MPLYSVSFFVSTKDSGVAPGETGGWGNSGRERESIVKRKPIGHRKSWSRKSGATDLKRAKLIVVIVSVLVLSSFAMQNPAGTGQTAPAASASAASAQNNRAQGQPAQGQPSPATAQQGAASQVSPTQIFGFRDFAKQYQVDQEFMASPSAA